MTRLDYCQFLLASQINYTLTYFADHLQKWSHDTIGRYLRGERITPPLVWDNVKDHVVPTAEGYLLFDDTVLDKNYSRKIEIARPQWSGNTKRVIEGIGVVTCVYVNPDQDRFWIIDYRIYAPDTDGHTKPDHVQAMLDHTAHEKRLPFKTVLMDTWYASMPLFKLHAETVKLLGGMHGLRDEPLLQSAVAKPRHLYTYGQAPTFYDLAAAYGYDLARNHPFLDGNKRTALLAIRAFLFIHGYAFQPEQVETVTMMEGVADGTMTQDILPGWIRDNTSPRNQQ